MGFPAVLNGVRILRMAFLRVCVFYTDVREARRVAGPLAILFIGPELLG